MRIASARDDARRVALTQTCRQLGDEAAGAVARALAEADDHGERRNLLSALAALGEQGMRQAELMVRTGPGRSSATA